jgi:hypothetical protein
MNRVLLGLVLVLASADGRDVWTGVERVVAVGDVHGDYQQFEAVLRSARLLDHRANWAGGKTHLVQVGDVLDRGAHSRKVMDLLMKLERQARRAGGRVHCLIGNHEAMNVYGDLRYVTPEEYAAFRDEDTPDLPGLPPGYAGHRAQLGPEGEYGRWIRSHNAIIRIDDTVFLHGGIGPKYAGLTIREINDRVREELSDFSKLEDGIVPDPEGPLWYRGLAQGDENELDGHVRAILENLRAKRIVVGHTFTDGAVTPRFGGRVLLIDIGLARLYDAQQRQACLLIEKGQPYALHRGQRLELPADGGIELVRYLKAAAALDPQPSSLDKRIAQLEAQLAGKAGPGAPAPADARPR